MNTISSITALLAFSLLFTGLAKNGAAQDDGSEKGFAPPYDRIGMTPLLLKPGSERFEYSLEEAFDQTEIPQKFDGNQIDDQHIKTDLPGSLPITDALETADAATDATGSGNSESSDPDKGMFSSITTKIASALVTMGKDKIKEEFLANELKDPVYDSIVRSRLNNSKVPHRIVDTLFSADKKGRYSMDLLLKRAKYNLTDAQAKRLQSSSKGLEGSVQDKKWVDKILTSNYILGFYFHDVTSMEDHYKNEGVSEDARTHVGYKAMVSAYLFRIDLNDSVQKVFYNNCWADESSSQEELAEARKARDQMDYPLELVRSYRFPVNSKELGQDPSDEKKKDLFYGLSREAMKIATNTIEKDVESFKVRSNLYDYKGPLLPFVYSKIGTKQGLQPDDRYFVYEYVADGDGGVEQKRKGVIRATRKVAVNDTGRSDSNEMSRFVQTAGWDLGKWMLMEQRPEYGISISPPLAGGVVHGNASFKNVRLGVRFSQALNNALDRHLFGPGWQFYVDGGWNKVDSTSENLITTGWGFGVAKQLYILRHTQLIPYLGLRREKTNFSSEDLHESLEKDYGNYGTVWAGDVGARLSLNITYWLKISTTFGYTPISYDGMPFGEDAINREWAGRFKSLEKGADNPFHQTRSDLRWQWAFRVVF